MYAVVDIETTGGYASNNDITEVAIVLHDGEKVISRFATLIKPRFYIPHHIQVLTGITPAMVADAPSFEEVAGAIYNMLQGNVFVAHNVNFDYSFLKHHLLQAGYELNCSKLCTVRLTRKVFPGLSSYSLGNLCHHFDIVIQNRHRAGGDVAATVLLLEMLLRNNALPHIEQFVKRGAKEQSLPPHLSKEIIEQLPYTPGVYYFHDQKGKIIYVGKAKNLRYRVRSHFSHNGAGKQRQDFLRNIYNITFQSCSTELMAFILESIEIKRLWPAFNRSQKRASTVYGLYIFEDRNGYIRLAIDKKKKHLQPLYTFNLLIEGQNMIKQLVTRFALCPKLCFIQTDNDPCIGLVDESCKGACESQETVHDYNLRVQEALAYIQHMLPTFVVMDDGNHRDQQSCILMEKGRFYGMGYVPAGYEMSDINTLKTQLTQYPENDYIRGLIYQFAERNPAKRVGFAG